MNSAKRRWRTKRRRRLHAAGRGLAQPRLAGLQRVGTQPALTVGPPQRIHDVEILIRIRADQNQVDARVERRDRAARQAGLTESLAGTESASDGALRASFRGASFDALAGMLMALAQQSAVVVKSGSVEATAEPGRVNASIVLRAATP